MLLESILGYKSVWRLLELLAEQPGKSYTRQELKNLTMLGNQPLSDALKRLVFSDILIKSSNMKRNATYWLNQGNYFTKKILEFIKAEREYWKMTGYDTLNVLNEFTRKCVEKANIIKKIILFGSVARQSSHAHSDIDLAMVVASRNAQEELIVHDIAEQIGIKFRRKIQVHYFSEQDFKTKSKLVEEIKKEGITFFD